MKHKRRWILPGLVAAMLVGFLIFAFLPEPVPVDTQKVTRAPFAVFVEDDGEARVRDVYLVSSPLPGRILRFEGEVGDVVKANETILTRILPSDPNFLDIRTRTELQSAVEAAEAAKALAQAEVRRIEAEVQFAKNQYERAQQLIKKGNISQAGMDRVEKELRTQEAALMTAKASLDIREHELETARAALINPSDRLNTPDEDEGGCCFNVRSPIDGRILKVYQESESVVTAGTPLLEIGDPKDLEIVVDLLSTDAVKVKPGDEVEILRWGGEGSLSGIVERIEPYGFTKVSSLGIEEQRVNVIIQLTDSYHRWQRLGHGYRVEAKIYLRQSDNVLQAPLSALFRSETRATNGAPRWAVFRMVSGRALLTPVSVGQFNDRSVEITGGLEEGDEVVLHPSDRVENETRLVRRSP